MRLLLYVVTALSVLTQFSCQGSGQPAADLVLAGGEVHTMDGANAGARAVAVADGRIVFVGSVEQAGRYRGSRTRWIELEGRTVLPGLIDAHGHMRNLGRYASIVRLVGTKSMAEVRALVDEAQAGTPAGRWLRGRGWDQNDWEEKSFPTWKDLEGTDKNPIYLRRVDGHAALVNREALRVCGITRDTPDPEGGRIVRFTDGEPTGVFVDNATDLITASIPEATPEELDAWMRSAIEECNRLGLVAVHDGGIDEAMLASLRRLGAAGQLTLRVYCMLSSETRDREFLSRAFAGGPKSEFDGRLVARAFKMYADGALGSRGAALLEPYADDPDNRGLLLTSREEMVDLTRQAVAAGFQPCAHAIGDRGNRIILDVYEEVLKSVDPLDRRFRLEHCQVLAPADLKRFRILGVLPSMQPTHATSDMYWAEDRIGPERVQGAYAWRTLIADGNRLVFGSDFPVESANPLWGIYAAVTRMDHEGWPEGGWYPAQRLSVAEAVEGFTINAAYAEFAEDTRGTLTVGKRADITVLDRDIFKSAPAEILNTRVVCTILDGDVVYESEPGQ